MLAMRFVLVVILYLHLTAHAGDTMTLGEGKVTGNQWLIQLVSSTAAFAV